MTVTFVDSDIVTAPPHTSSIVINTLAGVVDGDLLFTVWGGIQVGVTPPVGALWHRAARDQVSYPPGLAGATCDVWYRIASSEPASYTWHFTSYSSAVPPSVATTAYRGAGGFNDAGTAANAGSQRLESSPGSYSLSAGGVANVLPSDQVLVYAFVDAADITDIGGALSFPDVTQREYVQFGGPLPGLPAYYFSIFDEFWDATSPYPTRTVSYTDTYPTGTGTTLVEPLWTPAAKPWGWGILTS